MDPSILIASVGTFGGIVAVILTANYRSNAKIDSLRSHISSNVKDVHAKIDGMDDKFMRKNHAHDLLSRIDKDIRDLGTKIDAMGAR